MRKRIERLRVAVAKWIGRSAVRMRKRIERLRVAVAKWTGRSAVRMRKRIERLRVAVAKWTGRSAVRHSWAVGRATGRVGFAQLRPKAIEVPTEDPYRNDKLKRREFGTGICRLLSYGTNSGVIFLEGAWGSGKSAFLKMLAEQARRDGENWQAMIVIEINAWENHAFGKPIEHIARSIREGLKAQTTSWLLRNWLGRGWLRFKAVPGWIAGQPWISTGAGEWLLKLSWVKDAELASAVLSMLVVLGKIARCAGGAEKRLQDLKKDLAKEAKRFRRNQKPGVPWRIVVMIDELDRCRPDYAVRFLETVKHVFEVDHVAFVIAVNREQLVESMKGVYGGGVDAENYLERFGDVRLRLPETSREAFVRGVAEYMDVEAVLPNGIYEDDALEGVTATDMLVAVLGRAKDLNLREIEKIVGEIRAMLCVARERIEGCVMGAIAVALVRHVAPEAYAALLKLDEHADSAPQLLRGSLGLHQVAPVKADKDPVLTLIDDLLICMHADGQAVTGRVVTKKSPETERIRRERRRHFVKYQAIRDAIELYGSGVAGDGGGEPEAGSASGSEGTPNAPEGDTDRHAPVAARNGARKTGDVAQINAFVQARLQKEGRAAVGAVEAASWLDAEGLLADRPERPGQPLRRLLRKGRITGGEQQPNRRWWIRQAGS